MNLAGGGRLWRMRAGGQDCLPPAAVCLGNFDGVHRGHQALLSQCRALADARGLPLRAVTFDPLPREFFSPVQAPRRLSNLRDRVMALRSAGADEVVILRFDAALAAMSAEAFVDALLLRRLAAQVVVVGDDFRFGQARRGDVALLRQRAEGQGRHVLQSHTIADAAGERISSTRLRAALAEADFALANRLLGRDYTISARIVRGDQLGRQLGFATANLHHQLPSLPLQGVFAAHLRVGETDLPAVANLGWRPTLSGALSARVEAHVLDWQGDLYGQCAQLLPRAHLRAERKFANLSELKQAIAGDAAAARRWFAQPTPPPA